MQLSRDTARFDAVMDDMFGVGSADPIGVAVSGGGDSLALLHILAQWAAENGREVMAVTVDHGLRPEAAEEAKFVAAQCRTLAVPPHHTEMDRVGRQRKLAGSGTSGALSFDRCVGCRKRDRGGGPGPHRR